MNLTVKPIENPGAFDVLVAGGVTSPGLFKLGGGSAARKFKVDIRDPNGVQGAVITVRGWNATDGIKGTFYFWTDEQIAKFYSDFLPVFINAQTKNPKPVEASHPALAANDITKILLKQYGDLKSEGGSLWTVDCEWVEWRVGKKIPVQTPTAATGDLSEIGQTKSAVKGLFKEQLAITAANSGAP